MHCFSLNSFRNIIINRCVPFRTEKYHSVSALLNDKPLTPRRYAIERVIFYDRREYNNQTIDQWMFHIELKNTHKKKLNQKYGTNKRRNQNYSIRTMTDAWVRFFLLPNQYADRSVLFLWWLKPQLVSICVRDCRMNSIFIVGHAKSKKIKPKAKNNNRLQYHRKKSNCYSVAKKNGLCCCCCFFSAHGHIKETTWKWKKRNQH